MPGMIIPRGTRHSSQCCGTTCTAVWRTVVQHALQCGGPWYKMHCSVADRGTTCTAVWRTVVQHECGGLVRGLAELLHCKPVVTSLSACGVVAWPPTACRGTCAESPVTSVCNLLYADSSRLHSLNPCVRYCSNGSVPYLLQCATQSNTRTSLKHQYYTIISHTRGYLGGGILWVPVLISVRKHCVRRCAHTLIRIGEHENEQKRKVTE